MGSDERICGHEQLSELSQSLCKTWWPNNLHNTIPIQSSGDYHSHVDTRISSWVECLKWKSVANNQPKACRNRLWRCLCSLHINVDYFYFHEFVFELLRTVIYRSSTMGYFAGHVLIEQQQVDRCKFNSNFNSLFRIYSRACSSRMCLVLTIVKVNLLQTISFI